MSIKHPLRKLSKENWERYGKVRYMVEQLFGSIKQKVGPSFNLLREDLARKAYYLLFALSTALCFNLFLRYSVDF